MSNLQLDLTKEELQGSNFFDLGEIDSVVKKPISELSDAQKRNYLFENQDEHVNLYNIKLVTISGYLRDVPMMCNKNAITMPEGPREGKIGDQVLVGYLGRNRMPFIFSTITYDYIGARRDLRIPFEISEGETFLKCKSNFIHVRKDGAIVIKGARTLGNESISNSYIIIGGNQGKCLYSGKSVLYSVGLETIGNIIEADEDGNVYFDAQKSLNFLSLEEHYSIEKLLNIFIGTEQENDDTRSGEHNLVVGKKLRTYTGEEEIHEVGDITKDDNRKLATYSRKVAKKYTLQVGNNTTLTIEEINNNAMVDLVSNGRELKIDDNTKEILISQGTHKIVMKEDGIHFQEGSSHPVLLTYKFITKFNSHSHPHPTGPPIQQMIPSDVASSTVFVK